MNAILMVLELYSICNILSVTVHVFIQVTYRLFGDLIHEK